MRSMASAIEHGGEARLPAAVDFGQDVGRGPGRLDLPPNGVAVVDLVRQHDAAGGQAFEQQRTGLAGGSLPTGQQEGERTAKAVGEGVDLGRASAPRATDGLALLPPLAPCGAAVGLHGGGVDQHLRGRPTGLSEGLEQPNPDPLGRPAHEAIVEGLPRPVDLARRVRPAPSRFEHVDDAADHAPVVHALLAPRVGRQKRCDPRELLVRKPEMIHRPLP